MLPFALPAPVNDLLVPVNDLLTLVSDLLELVNDLPTQVNDLPALESRALELLSTLVSQVRTDYILHNNAVLTY